MKSAHYTIESFSVANFRSIDSMQTIKFNEVTALYGANASGKSNIWKALNIMMFLIRQSTRADQSELPFYPYLLRKGRENRPTVMELIFSDDDNSQIYEYSFSYDKDEIIDERLLNITKSIDNPVTLLDRNRGCKWRNHAKSGFSRDIFEQTRRDSLIITQARIFNNKYSAIIFSAINKITTIDASNSGILRDTSLKLMQSNGELKKRALEVLREADFSIRDFSFVPRTYEMANESKRILSADALKNLETIDWADITTIHSVRDDNGDMIGEVAFDIDNDESRGTNSFFNIIMPIIDALDNGKLIYIDEFGSGIHSEVSIYIIKLFRNNKNGAKLIINTHDSSLMQSGNGGVLSRDDLISVDKDMFEATRLTLFANKAYIREAANIEKGYRHGLYGGRPLIAR